MIKRIIHAHTKFKTSIKLQISIEESVIRAIKFNQEAWLELCTDMNAKLIKMKKHDFENDFFKLMSNSVFGKTMENVRKHRDIKLITTKAGTRYLVLQPNYHTNKSCSRD